MHVFLGRGSYGHVFLGKSSYRHAFLGRGSYRHTWEGLIQTPFSQLLMFLGASITHIQYSGKYWWGKMWRKVQLGVSAGLSLAMFFMQT